MGVLHLNDSAPQTTRTASFQRGGRPSLVEETAWFVRLCIAVHQISPCIAPGDHHGNGTERERSKRLARGALGPWARGVGSFSPRAPEPVQVERRLAWRTLACPPKDQPRSLLRLLEQGPESQSASSVCWGGVSSVMGPSDLDAHSFVPFWHKVISIKAHCLEGLNDRLLGWRAFQLVSSIGLVVNAH
ncbi:hypothetical protein SynRS9907_00545 [Synechococcus sp. RS9907]|nr:hypothetical protein SynRS9907_00545 [Synechococcus sp. RS9907]